MKADLPQKRSSGCQPGIIAALRLAGALKPGLRKKGRVLQIPMALEGVAENKRPPDLRLLCGTRLNSIGYAVYAIKALSLFL